MDQPKLKIPRHLAIIMDGNGRWAQRRNLPRIEGHRRGAQTVREIVTCCRKMGVQVLTLYSFSKENWLRPRGEVEALMRLLRHFLKAETQEMIDNGIRFHVIGNVDDLPRGVQEAIEKCRQATSPGREMQLNLALSYGGRDEIIRAVRKVIREVREGNLDPEDLNEMVFSSLLDTGGLPDPDLLIRTANEMRVSNFLLWQIAYTELYVTDVFWPDFREASLLEAFEAFTGRERRFGGLSPRDTTA